MNISKPNPAHDVCEVVRQLLFDKEHLDIFRVIPYENIRLSSFDALEHLAVGISVQIEGLSHKPLVHQHIIRKPDGPFQRWKKKHLPRWLLCFWPVKETIATVFSRWTWVCPHIVSPAVGKHFYWMVTKGGLADFDEESNK